MVLIKKLALFLNRLSIDVVLGAMGGLCFFSLWLGVDTPGVVYVALGLAVWVIYTFDHLMDAKNSLSAEIDPRRKIHKYHPGVIWTLIAVLVLVGLVLVWAYQSIRSIFIPAVVLWGIIGLYFGSLKVSKTRKSGAKEPVIAICYVAGITMYPISKVEWTLIPVVFYLYLAIYTMIALINLWILSYWDRETDLENGFSSISSLLSPGSLKTAIVFLGIATAGILLFLLFFQHSLYNMHALVLLLILSIHLKVFLGSPADIQTKRQYLEASFLLTWTLALV